MCQREILIALQLRQRVGRPSHRRHLFRELRIINITSPQITFVEKQITWAFVVVSKHMLWSRWPIVVVAVAAAVADGCQVAWHKKRYIGRFSRCEGGRSRREPHAAVARGV